MAIMDVYLSNIAAAVYGSEMRSNIYNALSEMAAGVDDVVAAVEAFQAAMPPLGDVDIVAGVVDGTIVNATASVSNVRFYAFAHCESLKTVDLPSATMISRSAFWCCYSLETANLPAALTIGSNAFAYCSSLSSVSIPAVTVIESNAFANCESLKTIDLPAVSSLALRAFEFCTSLSSVSLPAVISLSNFVFDECALTSIYLPSAEYIGSSAFYSCTSLATVSCPAAKSIGSYAFSGCVSLESAYFTGESVPSIGMSIFVNTPIANSTYLGYYGSIYVLSSLVSAFKSATRWSVYADRITAYEE